jgi:hypothetical protein
METSNSRPAYVVKASQVNSDEIPTTTVKQKFFGKWLEEFSSWLRRIATAEG